MWTMTDDQDYQDFVESMKTFEGDEKEELSWAVLGLNSEAGEVAGELEKMWRKGEYILSRQDKILDELGDVLWYIAAICNIYNVDIITLMQANVDKLEKRHAEGH